MLGTYENIMGNIMGAQIAKYRPNIPSTHTWISPERWPPLVHTSYTATQQNTIAKRSLPPPIPDKLPFNPMDDHLVTFFNLSAQIFHSMPHYSDIISPRHKTWNWQKFKQLWNKYPLSWNYFGTKWKVSERSRNPLKHICRGVPLIFLLFCK